MSMEMSMKCCTQRPRFLVDNSKEIQVAKSNGWDQMVKDIDKNIKLSLNATRGGGF